MKTLRTLALAAAMSVGVLGLSACGHTVEQRAASGALIGAGAGAAVSGDVGGAVAGGVAGAAIGAVTADERRCIERNRRGDCIRWDRG